MKSYLLLAALACLAPSLAAAEPPAGPLHAWYHDAGVMADGANVTAWENAATTNGAPRSLTRVVGRAAHADQASNSLGETSRAMQKVRSNK